MFFAVLGEIEFTVLKGPESWEASSRADYAELPRINQKPRLQFVGMALDEIRLDFSMHKLYGDPAADIKRLRTAMQAHTPLALVLGNGDYKGEFVITDVSESVLHSDGDGTTVYLEAQLTLREHAGDPANPPSPAVVPAGAAASVGTVHETAASLGGTGSGSNWQALLDSAKAGMAATTAATQSVAQLQSLAELVQSGDATRILGRLPGLLTDINERLPALGLSVDQAQQASAILGTTGDAARVARGTLDIQTALGQVNAAGAGATLSNALDKANALLGLSQRASSASDTMKPAMTHLTAQVATRGMTP